MPELPEVETVRRGLEQLVIGKTIQSVSVYWDRMIEGGDKEKVAFELVGQTVEAIQRRGKFLIFRYTANDLISHLRMEGKYEFFPQETPPSKHTHVIFHFTDGSELHYQDVRKFGRFALVAKGKSAEYAGIAKLGPEPTNDQFLLGAFQQGLVKSKKAVKPLLLEQKLVTGLGNIYVDEALWQAKIHPERLACTLTTDESIALHQAIIDVLGKAVIAGGTTIRTYHNALGEAGTFQVALHAYGQQGKPCSRCGTLIVKTKVAQRGTHFCPNCQKVEG